MIITIAQPNQLCIVHFHCYFHRTSNSWSRSLEQAIQEEAFIFQIEIKTIVEKKERFSLFSFDLRIDFLSPLSI